MVPGVEHPGNDDGDDDDDDDDDIDDIDDDDDVQGDPLFSRPYDRLKPTDFAVIGSLQKIEQFDFVVILRQFKEQFIEKSKTLSSDVQH